MSVELNTEQLAKPVEAVVAPVETPPQNTEISETQETVNAELPSRVGMAQDNSTIQISQEFKQKPVIEEDSNDTSGDRLRKIFEAKDKIRQSEEEIPVL